MVARKACADRMRKYAYTGNFTRRYWIHTPRATHACTWWGMFTLLAQYLIESRRASSINIPHFIFLSQYDC